MTAPPSPIPLAERLRAIQARLEKATQGPWWQGPYYKADVDSSAGIVRANCWMTPQAIADAEFIAHAREDIPYLLAALTDLTARAEEAQRQIDRSEAQRKGMEDFLSGQPKEFPKWGDLAAKESSLNFAWTVGYECAQASEVFKVMVNRADRTAARAERAEAEAIVAKHHRLLELLSKGSATEQLEKDLRIKLAEAEIRADQAEAALAGLREYVQHKADCRKWMWDAGFPGVAYSQPILNPKEPCTCGLSDILAPGGPP